MTAAQVHEGAVEGQDRGGHLQGNFILSAHKPSPDLQMGPRSAATKLFTQTIGTWMVGSKVKAGGQPNQQTFKVFKGTCAVDVDFSICF